MMILNEALMKEKKHHRTTIALESPIFLDSRTAEKSALSVKEESQENNLPLGAKFRAAYHVPSNTCQTQRL